MKRVKQENQQKIAFKKISKIKETNEKIKFACYSQNEKEMTLRKMSLYTMVT